MVTLGGGGHGQERVGEHGQGGPSVPGGPARDLVLIQPGQILGGLEGFFDDDAENPDSATETFVAVKAEISNWRWAV